MILALLAQKVPKNEVTTAPLRAFFKLFFQ